MASYALSSFGAGALLDCSAGKYAFEISLLGILLAAERASSAQIAIVA